eukprot:1690753-Ditylum_brightwellii.AAC.1
MSGEETLQSKHAYERVAAAHSVNVKRYHLDNGRFGEKSFRAVCDEQGQEITFCGVGSHHQNSIAESQAFDFEIKDYAASHKETLA